MEMEMKVWLGFGTELLGERAAAVAGWVEDG